MIKRIFLIKLSDQIQGLVIEIKVEFVWIKVILSVSLVISASFTGAIIAKGLLGDLGIFVACFYQIFWVGGSCIKKIV